MLIGSNSSVYHLYHQKSPEEVAAALALQENAKKAAKSGQSGPGSSSVGATFLANAMEQLTLNKIGVDKEKLEELKREIEALQNQENPSQAQKDRLKLITEKLGEMAQQAMELAEKRKANGNASNQLQSYQAIAAMTSAI